MTTHHSGEFDAAKAIVDTLKPFDGAQQERILRWVAESIGVASPLTLPKTPAGAGTPSPGVTLPPAGGGSGGAGDANTDIRTFARAKKPKSDNQMAAVIAYFHRFIAPPAQRQETINKDLLADAIRQIGSWEQPKRPTMTLNNAKNQGYLDAAGGGEFRINSVGENLVTMTLGGNGEAVPTTGKGRPKGGRGAKRTTKKDTRPRKKGKRTGRSG